jgi:rhodanese-related sulfurtransferase
MSEEGDVAPERASELLAGGEAGFIDVREDYEWEAGRIPGARHIELTRLSAEAGSLDEDRTLVFYCRTGERSAMAAEALRAAGRDARSLEGGLAAWAERGLPLEPETGTVAPRRPGP